MDYMILTYRTYRMPPTLTCLAYMPRHQAHFGSENSNTQRHGR